MPHLRYVLLSILWAAACLAQDRGTITGTVTDPAGAAVPGAAGKIDNPATGLWQAATTRAEGSDTLACPPGREYPGSAAGSPQATACCSTAPKPTANGAMTRASRR